MDPHFDAYMQYGRGTGGPFMTERIEVRHSPRSEGRKSVNGPLASNWEAKVDGNWRRIWIAGKSRFIRLHGETIAVDVCPHPTPVAN